MIDLSPEAYLLGTQPAWTTESDPPVIGEYFGYQISKGVCPIRNVPIYHISVIRRDRDNDPGTYGVFFHVSYDECEFTYDENRISMVRKYYDNVIEMQSKLPPLPLRFL